jgi:hypothetical protein
MARSKKITLTMVAPLTAENVATLKPGSIVREIKGHGGWHYGILRVNEVRGGEVWTIALQENDKGQIIPVASVTSIKLDGTYAIMAK